jgi:peptidoglycan hydrolase-like protein with peptidoglycan-binding domain
MGLGALLAIPLVAGGALSLFALARSPLDSASDVAPLIATVGSAERDDRVNVTVTLAEPESFVVTTQTAGLVTALGIAPGAALVDGQTALEVDGLPVTAYVAPAPLYRDIARGIEGKDVATAQRFLQTLGYLVTVDGKAGPLTAKAITKFNKDHGRSANGEVLSLDSLLWVPTDSEPPVKVSVRVGTALSPQDELYSTSTGHDTITVATEAAIVDRLLTVGQTSVTLPAGATAVTDPADVEAIAPAAKDVTSANAFLALSTPRVVGTIPASALVTDPKGATCFFSDVAGPGTTVVATDGSFGIVDVDPGLVGTSVLVNPRDVREDLACD